MSATVTVGFAPASAPAISAGLVAAPAAASGSGDGENPFAALLALVGTTTALPAEPATDGTTAAPAVTFSVPKTAALPAVDLTDLSTAPALQTETGKSLLSAFGKALIAVKDALADGKPIDPTLEKKLQETVDDLAALLGITLPQPVQTPFAPTIAAAASGQPVIPVGEASPIPVPDLPQTPDLPTAAAPPQAETATDLASPAIVTLPGGAVAPDSLSASEPVAQAAPAEAPVATLAKLVDDLGARLQQQSPDLANKLKAVAEALSSGSVPTDVLARIGLSTEPGKSAPDLTQLIDALAVPAATKSKPASVFTAPALAAPTAVLPKGGANDPETSIPKAAAATTGGASAATDASVDPRIEQPQAALDPTSPKSEKRADTPNIEGAGKSGASLDAAKADKTGAGANDAAPEAPAAAAPSQVAATGIVAGTRAVHAAYQAAAQQINLPQVAFEVARQVQAGNSRFQIRLDPADLGRIDVRLDVDKDGTVNARMYVERPETLDLMQRDQRALQQALQQAGLDGAKTSLEFSLRQNPFAGNPGGNGGGNAQAGFGPFGDPAIADAAAEAVPLNLYRGTSTASGVNLVV